MSAGGFASLQTLLKGNCGLIRKEEKTPLYVQHKVYLNIEYREEVRMSRRSRRLVRMERYMMKRLLLIIAALTLFALAPLALLISAY